MTQDTKTEASPRTVTQAQSGTPDHTLEALLGIFVAATRDGLARATALVSEARANLDDNVATTKQIFLIVHDTKGQGLTFGYPLITRVGSSLCDFIRHVTQPLTEEQLLVVGLHLEALSFAIENDVTGPFEANYGKLVAHLDRLVQETETPS